MLRECNIKVSVIVPVYNVGRYLEECLSSLTGQTFKEIEIILINDGSTDNSQAIIDAFLKKYPEIISCIKKENEGQAVARNIGIEMAKGEYIIFVDSDDYVRKDMIEKLYVEAVNTCADMVVCGVCNLYPSGKTEIRSMTYGIEGGNNIYENPAMLAHASGYSVNKIYKRDLFTANDIKFPSIKFEDAAIAYTLMAVAKKIVYIDEPLYVYRISRAGSTTNSLNKGTYDVFVACDMILDYYQKNGLYEKFKEEIDYRIITHITMRFIMLKKIKDIKAVCKYVDDAFDYLDNNLKNWKDNKYYNQRIQHSIDNGLYSEFVRAREDRKSLKKYYKKQYIKRLIKHFK